MVDLELRFLKSDKVLGRVVNLSQGGMLVNATEEFERGAMLALRIPFERPVDGEVFFDFEAEVVWCMPDAQENYSVGLQFSKNSELQYQFLQKMVYLYTNTEK